MNAVYPRKQGLTFHANLFVSMKCQILFPGKNKKKIFQNFTRVLSIKVSKSSANVEI